MGTWRPLDRVENQKTAGGLPVVWIWSASECSHTNATLQPPCSHVFTNKGGYNVATRWLHYGCKHYLTTRWHLADQNKCLERKGLIVLLAF